MNWDSPLPTKLFIGAAGVVLVAGWVVTHMDRMPTLSAASDIAAVSDSGMRDAVASPALPMAAGGWLQAAALSRGAQVPSLLNPVKQSLPPRPTSGRAVFSARRVIVDWVPGSFASR
ncbi:MAG: hypothetical protein NTY77_17640 [Elusimicrobia bacterium]|nr:hypothetical protein [Elusimicrobiota bacterium]